MWQLGCCTSPALSLPTCLRTLVSSPRSAGGGEAARHLLDSSNSVAQVVQDAQVAQELLVAGDVIATAQLILTQLLSRRGLVVDDVLEAGGTHTRPGTHRRVYSRHHRAVMFRLERQAHQPDSIRRQHRAAHRLTLNGGDGRMC